MLMGMTVTQKILAAHAGLESVAAGQLIEETAKGVRRGKTMDEAFYNKLYSDGYVPFTFAEFLGTDPVEDGKIDVLEGEIKEEMTTKEIAAYCELTEDEVKVLFTFFEQLDRFEKKLLAL